MFSKLNSLPGAPQLHRWADWAELLAFTSPTGTLSVPEFTETAERQLAYIETEGVDNQDDTEKEQEPLVEEASQGPAQFRDAITGRAGDVFRYLEDRAERFSSTYPFTVDSSRRLITTKELTQSRRIYIFLLSCASFRYVEHKAVQTSLASRFELLGLEVVRRMLPATNEVHLFGANSITHGKYTGTLKQKIEMLAADLGEKSLLTDDDFETGDSGDNGLDVVAWMSHDDSLPGKLAVFGQAACTPQWISKQHSSSPETWSAVMTLMSSPLNFTMIPFDFRRPGGTWYSKRHIHKSMVIDRQRIINYLSTGPNPNDPIYITDALRGHLYLNEIDDAFQQEADNI